MGCVIPWWLFWSPQGLALLLQGLQTHLMAFLFPRQFQL